MPLRNSQQAYGSIARSAHWATALFVLLAWLLGQFRDVLPRGAARDLGLSVHMALGLGVILLFVLRLVWRALDPPPPAIRRQAVRALARLRRFGRTPAALRAADRDAGPRHCRATRARPGVAGVRPVRHCVAVDDGSRFLPRDARPAPTRGQRARRRRRWSCRSGAVPPLGAGRSYAGAHAAGTGLNGLSRGAALHGRGRQAGSGRARRPMRWQMAKTRSARFIV